MASNAVLEESENDREPSPSPTSGSTKKTNKKERKLWSMNEQLCLIEGVKANFAVLEGKFSAALTFQDKKVSYLYNVCTKLLKWGPTG